MLQKHTLKTYNLTEYVGYRKFLLETFVTFSSVTL